MSNVTAPLPPALSGECGEAIKNMREMADHLEQKSAQLLKDVGMNPTPHAAVPLLRKAASLLEAQAAETVQFRSALATTIGKLKVAHDKAEAQAREIAELKAAIQTAINALPTDGACAIKLQRALGGKTP